MAAPLLHIAPYVAERLAAGAPVVALESTLICHGLPWPTNLETARLAEQAIREQGATPATIAVLAGVPTIGLDESQLLELARNRQVQKSSSRDLGFVIARKLDAATTVAATMRLAFHAGIRLFATGGIGGAHRGAEKTGDISADLWELAHTPVAVICAGAKSLLDIPRTLEILESYAVPVVGYGTEHFPGFLCRDSGAAAPASVDTTQDAAALLKAHWATGGAGAVIAQPVSESAALARQELEGIIVAGEDEARRRGIHGPGVTPFLLDFIARATDGRSLRANQALVVANASLAARIACQLAMP
jgi:pseudouridine-5'-phosphate glycosidase